VDIIATRKDAIAIEADAITVDVDDFEAGLAARLPQELEAAIALYAGPFLDGLYMGSGPFDDWATSQRDRLHSRALEALERLARLVDLEKGLVLADRLVDMEPTREASYRLKMELLIACGRRDGALRAFEICKAMLSKEFGAEVSEETIALRRSALPASDPAPNSVSSANGMPQQRQGRSSISVAEFVNLTGERGDDYFAKGLVQDITTALSEVSDYVVLSGFSRWQKNGAGSEPQNQATSRARYVLSGSVQRSGSGLRVPRSETPRKRRAPSITAFRSFHISTWTTSLPALCRATSATITTRDSSICWHGPASHARRAAWVAIA
jgi:TolB-like protein